MRMHCEASRNISYLACCCSILLYKMRVWVVVLVCMWWYGDHEAELFSLLYPLPRGTMRLRSLLAYYTYDLPPCSLAVSLSASLKGKLLLVNYFLRKSDKPELCT